MDTTRHILVAVDFDKGSAAALSQAVRIAQQAAERVRAVHVITPPVLFEPNAYVLPLEILPNDLLDEARASWSAWPSAREAGPKATFEAFLGRPRDELPELAAAPGCELLVVGARSEDGRRGGMGPVASACVQRSRTPVLVVRDGQVGRFNAVAACVDFTDTCVQAVEWAVRFAAQDNAALHIFHVYADPWRDRPLPAAFAGNMPDARERLELAVESRTRSFCAPWQREISALKARFHATSNARSGRGLVKLLSEARIDLAVLGTRTRWSVSDAIWGSAAESVFRNSTCAVLGVRPIEKRG